MARMNILPLAALAGFFATVHGGESEFSISLTRWTPDLMSPALCMGRPTWFLSVIPEEFDAAGLKKTTLVSGGDTYDAEILHLDEQFRLCLLEVEAAIPSVVPFRAARSGQIKPGTKLRCLSANASCQTTIAGKDRTYQGTELTRPLLRVRLEDAERFCRPGTPLINEEGELEGMLTGKRRAGKGEGYAIPASQLHKLVEDFARFNRSGLVWVGLVFHNDSPTPEVLEVRPDSPASEAGIQEGDVILQLNLRDTNDLETLTEAIYDLPAGMEANLKILRGLETMNLTFVPEFASP